MVDQLATIGWQHVLDVDGTMRRVTLGTTDGRGRKHAVYVLLPDRFGDATGAMG